MAENSVAANCGNSGLSPSQPASEKAEPLHVQHIGRRTVVLKASFTKRLYIRSVREEPAHTPAALAQPFGDKLNVRPALVNTDIGLLLFLYTGGPWGPPVYFTSIFNL
jgi:hypothetical protein